MDAGGNGNGSRILADLDGILSTWPNINELGVVPTTAILHPQTTSRSDPSLPDYDKSTFWYGEDKLAITFSALGPLYSAASRAFWADLHLARGLGEEERSCHVAALGGSASQARAELDAGEGPEVAGGGGAEAGGRATDVDERLMRWSRAILLVNSDHGTAWNARRRIILGRLNGASGEIARGMWEAELRLSALVLSLRAKSAEAWGHRRWVLRSKTKGLGAAEGARERISYEDFLRETLLVQQAAERSRMNYRAWSHRCRLVPHVAPAEVLEELTRSQGWVNGQPADSSAYHYRQCLLQRLLKLPSGEEEGGRERERAGGGLQEEEEEEAHPPEETVPVTSIRTIWEDEFCNNAQLIRVYRGREALWGHRRFLFHHWATRLSRSACLEDAVQRWRTGGSKDIQDGGAPYTGSAELDFAKAAGTEAKADGSENGNEQRRLAASYLLWCLRVLDGILKTEKDCYDKEDVIQRLASEERLTRERLQDECTWLSKLWNNEEFVLVKAGTLC